MLNNWGLASQQTSISNSDLALLVALKLLNLKIPSQHTCGETTKGTKICNDSFHWCQVEIPRLQSAIYRLDYWWYTQRVWLTPKSPYVKQRSFLNGTDIYCIDATLLDNNWLPQWVPDSLFPFPPSLSCHQQSHGPVAVFHGSRYTIKSKEN